MTHKTQNYILTILRSQWDYYQAEILFLKHQRDLPPQHRKIADEYGEISRQVYELEKEQEKVTTAINELNEIPF